MTTRRAFLRGSALAIFGTGSAPAWMAKAVDGAVSSGARRKALVAIFQRGAADGLNIVVPFGEKRYYEMRPTIAVGAPARTGAAPDACIDLDGFFGLHPALAPLKPLYDAKHLAVLDAVGSPDPTRSHFDAQDYMESGTPGLKATRDGWLNRALPPTGEQISPLRAVAMDPVVPRSLRGRNRTVAVGNLQEFRVNYEPAAPLFQAMYAAASDKLLQGLGAETFEATRMMQTIEKQPYVAAGGAEYPPGRLGQSLRQIARLIKADAGVEAAFADIGGWDHHVNEVGQRASEGPLANLLGGYGQALAAFWKDMGDRMEDVVVVTMSEFGRTARENGNRGTDHGHANVMFVMGGGVRGGKVYGDWPGLHAEQLYEGRDLNLTTDFRDVLGELVFAHLGNRDLKSVFPGYEAVPARFKGLLKA